MLQKIKQKYKRYKRLKGLRTYRKLRNTFYTEYGKFLAYMYYVGGEGKLEDLYKLFNPEIIRRAWFAGYFNVYDKNLGWKDHLFNTDAYKKYDNGKK